MASEYYLPNLLMTMVLLAYAHIFSDRPPSPSPPYLQEMKGKFPDLEPDLNDLFLIEHGKRKIILEITTTSM